MDLVDSLQAWREELVEGAFAQLWEARLAHYEREGPAAARERLATLLELALRCLAERRAEPMVEHATRIARERFDAGFVLLEVQTAINVLEEALWKRILAGVAPEEIAGALGLVSAIFGMAKDALARTYVELALRRAPPEADAPTSTASEESV